MNSNDGGFEATLSSFKPNQTKPSLLSQSLGVGFVNPFPPLRLSHLSNLTFFPKKRRNIVWCYKIQIRYICILCMWESLCVCERERESCNFFFLFFILRDRVLVCFLLGTSYMEEALTYQWWFSIFWRAMTLLLPHCSCISKMISIKVDVLYGVVECINDWEIRTEEEMMFEFLLVFEHS